MARPMRNKRLSALAKAPAPVPKPKAKPKKEEPKEEILEFEPMADDDEEEL